MNTLFTSASEVITPEVAKSYLQHNVNNRPLNRARINYYADQMQKGNWKLNGEAICFDMAGNLVNGQHRLEAIVTADIPIEMLVCRNVDDESFKTYDSGANRRAADVFALCDILNATSVSAIVRRYFLMNRGNEGTVFSDKQGGNLVQIKLSNADMVEIYNQHAEVFQEICNYSRCLAAKYKFFPISTLGGTICYLHLTAGFQLEEIYNFFDFVYEYREHPSINGGKEPMCTKLLRQRLIQTSEGRTRFTGKFKSNLLAKAWNAYIQKTPMKILKVAENEQVQFIKSI